MGFLSAGHNLGKKILRGATNTKVAKAAPGGKSIGKTIRNLPGMKAPTPAPTGGLGPSAGMQAKQLPALSPEPVGMDVAQQRPMPMPMQQEQIAPPPAPMPQPGGDMGMGEAMGRPAVMPRSAAQPMEDMGGLGPSPNQNQFAALAQRMAPVMNRFQSRRR